MHHLRCHTAFPEDDRLEYDLETVKRQYGEIQGSLNAESRAAELLARAAKAMDLCQKNVQEALGYSRYGTFFLFFLLPCG